MTDWSMGIFAVHQQRLYKIVLSKAFHLEHINNNCFVFISLSW